MIKSLSIDWHQIEILLSEGESLTKVAHPSIVTVKSEPIDFRGIDDRTGEGEMHVHN